MYPALVILVLLPLNFPRRPTDMFTPSHMFLSFGEHQLIISERRFVCGNTYGDATRAMPVCFDTKGYSHGVYNETKKGVTPTVIPVRI